MQLGPKCSSGRFAGGERAIDHVARLREAAERR